MTTEDPVIAARTRQVMEEIRACVPNARLADVPTLFAFGPIYRAIYDASTLLSSDRAVHPEADDEPLHTGDDARLDCATNIRCTLEEAIDELNGHGEIVDSLRSALEECTTLDTLIVETIKRERASDRAVKEPDTKNRYGCKQCQRDFNHEPFTTSIGGIPARTYFFCTPICRERWNMGYTGEPPQMPKPEQVIRVAENISALVQPRPACKCGVAADVSHYCSALDHCWIGRREQRETFEQMDARIKADVQRDELDHD